MIALVIAFLDVFGRRFRDAGPIGRFLAANAYTVYLVHQTVLLFFHALLLRVPVPTALKLAVSACCAAVFSLGISAGLRALPFAKRVLG